MTLAFVVELRGGLANRFRALWSAHAFAVRYGRPVVVLWPVTAELACDHQKLFTVESPVWLITVDPARPWQNLVLRLARWLFSSLGLGLNAPVEAGEAWGRPMRFAPRWMPFQWIQTCAEFESIHDLPAPFFPTHNLRIQAESRLAQARASAGVLVGVHIRRNDHHHAIACSDTNAFVAAMQDQLNREPASRFLLCTDDPSEHRLLHDLFGDRLVWYPPECLDRSRELSAIYAFIDFLTLAGCNSILGSYQSSFSLLAARFSGVPYLLVGDTKSSST